MAYRSARSTAGRPTTSIPAALARHWPGASRKPALPVQPRVSDPAADAARDAVEMLPKLAKVETITGIGSVSVMLHLQEAIQAAQQVMKHAKTPEGAVRN